MVKIENLISKIITTQKAMVLAVIVDGEGSAYQEGAWMLFIEGDRPIGILNQGSFENDLHNRSGRLFRTGQTEVISYDLSKEDEADCGRGAGCHGIVHILLRDIDENFQKILTSMNETLRKMTPILYIQSINDLSQYIFSHQDEDTFGFWDSDADWEWIHAKPSQKIVGQKNFGTQTYFIQLIWP
ncbi:XdhC family protein [Sporosarcina ureilytica]|uniref:XdhC- CoxI domain-containing protein n=1 Tax=Sporosarcina ureilytica TaxID=298596 RepID=A0A1D8JG97_9BACL|nr:XdhC family protein [Sporosarcina ureilytica]AOV07713.1 hypothetical protein BI350_09325 [Sporosarcina ureilytica]